MNKRDYYDVLGVNKTASDKDIKKAYRDMCKTHHPDKGGDEELFKEIAEAYSILSDKNKRLTYDKYGHNTNRMGGPNMNDIYSAFREQFRQQTTYRGHDIKLVIDITLNDVYTGLTKKYTYNRYDTCKECNGEGGHDPIVCQYCGGMGTIINSIKTPAGIYSTQTTCLHCNGDGKTYSSICNSCKGSGVSEIKDNIEINIPRGIINGNIMKIYEKGHAVKGGIPGNILVYIKVEPHDIFQRENDSDNIILIKKIPYYDMILGDKIEVPIIDGSKVKVDIPACSDNDTILRLRGKGLPNMNTGNFGDMLIKLSITLPKNPDKKELDLLKNIKENY